MSDFDRKFKNNVREILAQPVWQPSRAHWDDGVMATTKHIFGVTNRYDLRKEYPIGTLRPLAMQNCIDEILWIYQKKSNNIHDLKSHIWDSWADANGSIGAAYGWQVANKLQKLDGKFLDQIDSVIWKLKETPFDRRIMIMLYSPSEEQLMGLAPCAYSCTFNVTVDEDDRLVLNMLLNQRSQDMIVANNWNVFQYSILLTMIAEEVDMIPGEILHVIADAHIYDRHEDIAKELLERPEYPAPILSINGNIAGFYDFDARNFSLINYAHGDQIKNIPVAI